MATRSEILRLRSDLRDLVGIAASDLDLLFRKFDTIDAAEAALRDVLPTLVAIYGDAAIALGADWYDEVRESSGARGRFRAVPGDLPDRGSTDALARWAASEATDLTTMLPLVVGGVQRRVTDGARGSIIRSTAADPATAGWQRVGIPECGFCAMLIDRGAVYSADTANFGSHDNCNCQAVPVLKGAVPIDVRDYVPSTRNIPDADKARAKAWIQDHL